MCSGYICKCYNANLKCNVTLCVGGSKVSAGQYLDIARERGILSGKEGYCPGRWLSVMF